MSHFYGVLNGQRGEATRCGSKASGLTVTAASWNGAIAVHLYVDDDGNDCFEVREKAWRGHGIERVISTGLIGKRATP